MKITTSASKKEHLSYEPLLKAASGFLKLPLQGT